MSETFVVHRSKDCQSWLENCINFIDISWLLYVFMVQPKEGKHMIELQSPGGWEVQNLCYIWIKLSYIYKMGLFIHDTRMENRKMSICIWQN